MISNCAGLERLERTQNLIFGVLQTQVRNLFWLDNKALLTFQTPPCARDCQSRSSSERVN